MIRISQPLLFLLGRAGLAPEKINSGLEARMSDRRGVFRWDHSVPRRIMRATGLEVDMIRRRNRAILFEVNDRRLIYRERSRLDCILTIPQVIPETVALAVVGARIEAVVDLGEAGRFLEGTTIVGLEDSWEGSITFVVRPKWEPLPASA